MNEQYGANEPDYGDPSNVHDNSSPGTGRFRFQRFLRHGRHLVGKAVSLAGPDVAAIAALRHEYALLAGLVLPGIVTVLELMQCDGDLVLVMEDAGASNLAECIDKHPLGVAEFLDMSVQLALATANLHAAGILHRNICPENIAWNARSGRVTLVDFAIATTVVAEAASPVQIEGTLAYMSPEQTGRTARVVDTRSDLYSLGATLYALLAGRPPFTALDSIGLIHAQLAQSPAAVHLAQPQVPPILSEILGKLLEKAPERRYQRAEALIADLREAASQWDEKGLIEPFPLGRHEVPAQLSIPGQLYGRANEISLLLETFERAAGGVRELVLVTGAPGIGKTALVEQLAGPVTGRRGYFIAGKFDQLQRSVPYAGLIEAFRQLVRQVLTEPDAALVAWRAHLQAAVTPNGRILLDVIPELGALLGPQAAVTELGPVEARHRFNQVFTSFLNACSPPARPLALFLDDVQWADSGSLQLLENWMQERAGHLLVVAAYRHGEVDRLHPLADLLARLRAARSVPAIHLGPLATADATALVADTLNRPPGDCAALAELMVRKTAGNPFFLRRLLKMLHGEGLIHYSLEDAAWHWDIGRIERAPVTDNVLDLMVQAIGRLPEPARCLLQAAACVGHQFELGVLASVTGQPHANVMRELWPALEDGLIVTAGEADMAPRGSDPRDNRLAEIPVILRFVHDRVQQAAYMLLTSGERDALHVAIGRALLDATGAPAADELFLIVDQFNLGAALLADPAERLRLARLNAEAGRKARASTAYGAAFDYLTAACRLLAPDSWDAEPTLAYMIHRDLAECAYLTGEHTVAEQLLETALSHQLPPAAQADLYSLRVLAATVAGDWAGALHWGWKGLAVFGQEWPRAGLAEAIEAEAAAVMANLGGRAIADLVNAPEARDEEVCSCMRLLSLLGPPAYFSGSEVLAFLVTRGANLSLLHGASVYSAFAYVFHGALHNARTGEYDVGHAFGEVALVLARRFGNRAEQSRTLEVFGLLVHAWRRPLRDSLPLLREGHRAGVESGELAYAAFNLCSILINGLPAGIPLPTLLDEANAAIEFGTRYRNRTAVEILLPFRQFARALSGATRSPASFDDDEFDEGTFLREAAGNQTALGQYWVARLQAAFLAGEYDTAWRCAQAGEQTILAGILGMVTCAEHVFYSALTLAARGAEEPLSGITRLHERLALWAGHCPANVLHKQRLVEAELHRLAGKQWAALESYTAAIDGARENGFDQDAALANMLAGRFFAAQGQPAMAAMHLRTARDGFRAWGAATLAAEWGPTHAPEPDQHIAARAAFAETLDAQGLIKASLAIAAETIPDRLFERILRIIAEVAGADAGALVLGGPDVLMVRARITVRDSTRVALYHTRLEECTRLPGAIVRYVARLQEPVVLADAAGAGPFAADPDVGRLGLCSVLCVPLRQHAQLVGVLLLENRALPGAFTAKRVDVVQALAAQAAIALENSALLREREGAQQAAAFLSGAGAVLAESLDSTTTLRQIAALAVPAFADWCLLDLAAADGTLQRAEVVAADAAEPANSRRAEALRRAPPGRVGMERHVLREEAMPDGVLALARGDADLQALLEIAPRSMIAVPLVARGRTLGMLTFLTGQGGRRYGEADLAVARKFADRCALAIDNAHLYRQMQDAVKVREDFLAVASHELRTPLTPLMIQIQLMQRRLPALARDEDSAASLARSLAVLQRQAVRLLRLVDELLDIARISGGRLALTPEPVDLVALVDDVIKELAAGGEITPAAALVNMTHGSDVHGFWDRLRVEQVVSNLISNAVKYGKGKPVEVYVWLEDGTAAFSVTDHGLGIAAEHLERIFGRFERAVPVTQYSGLGLGLYIVSEITTALGGTIHVASVLGEGSTFTVRLPLGWGGKAVNNMGPT
ncbi:sensor histidine kinase [Pseudoduganella lutea]|uniref:histidine kinase n=1 Tax=Pseudoduganella lutea TaxID=321985 RepID=A0A4P6L4L9_9BURK|nr:AAA family ATPase [Pseudoduganella lutea]QBE66427.1 GAF domain-containing protein [Pseudoduganella lutea]